MISVLTTIGILILILLALLILIGIGLVIACFIAYIVYMVTDKENWFLSEKVYNSGRNLVEFEANLLIKYAKEGKIYDLNI